MYALIFCVSYRIACMCFLLGIISFIFLSHRWFFFFCFNYKHVFLHLLRLGNQLVWVEFYVYILNAHQFSSYFVLWVNLHSNRERWLKCVFITLNNYDQREKKTNRLKKNCRPLHYFDNIQSIGMSLTMSLYIYIISMCMWVY